MRVCSGCQSPYPRTSEYWPPNKGCREGLDTQCRECRKAASRRYYAGHRVEHAARVTRWKDGHTEAFREYQSTYNQTHRERIAARMSDWYTRNKVRVSATKAAYYAAHRAEYAQSSAAWWRVHPDAARAKVNRRRARIAGNGGSFTAKEWQNLCVTYDHRCLRCGREDQPLAADHIQPVSKGGSSDISNIQPLCRSCNSWKGARYIDFRPTA